jgi:hypothetical protein
MDRGGALKLLRGGPDGIAEWNQRRWAGEEFLTLCLARLCERPAFPFFLQMSRRDLVGVLVPCPVFRPLSPGRRTELIS